MAAGLEFEDEESAVGALFMRLNLFLLMVAIWSFASEGFGAPGGGGGEGWFFSMSNDTVLSTLDDIV